MTLLLILLALCPCPVKRNAQGHIIRNHAAVAEFRRLTGYPHGRKGYVVDHVVPLCACGFDGLRNFQWQRADSARMKDRLEREACDRLTR